MAETSRSGRITGEVEDQIKVIREDVSELTKIMKGIGEDKFADAAKAARGRVDEWVSNSRRKVDEAGSHVREKARSVEDFVVEKPIQSAIIALLVGMVIGSMSRR